MGKKGIKNNRDSGLTPGSLLLIEKYKPIIDLLNKYEKIKNDTDKYSKYNREWY